MWEKGRRHDAPTVEVKEQKARSPALVLAAMAGAVQVQCGAGAVWYGAAWPAIALLVRVVMVDANPNFFLLAASATSEGGPCTASREISGTGRRRMTVTTFSSFAARNLT